MALSYASLSEKESFMNDHYVVMIYYKDLVYTQHYFPIDQIEKIKEYRDRWLSKELFTAKIYKICPELIEL